MDWQLTFPFIFIRIRLLSWKISSFSFPINGYRIGDEERRLMHLVPAPAVRLMKRRDSSRPGVYNLMSRETPGQTTAHLKANQRINVLSGDVRFILTLGTALDTKETRKSGDSS